MIDGRLDACLSALLQLDAYKAHAKKIVKNLTQQSPVKLRVDAGQSYFNYIIQVPRTMAARHVWRGPNLACRVLAYAKDSDGAGRTAMATMLPLLTPIDVMSHVLIISAAITAGWRLLSVPVQQVL